MRKTNIIEFNSHPNFSLTFTSYFARSTHQKMTTIRVAYIPEHFSTPLFFAQQQGYYEAAGIKIQFIPVIEGSGRLIKLLNDNEIDIAIGLTEAFVADISKGNDSYNLVGTYVESPLCWAISTGVDRKDITKPDDLQGRKIGVSRIGSGSYVMSFVLGLQNKFSTPFFKGYPILSNFKNLRDSVNLKNEDSSLNSDAFMWEYFTSKKYYDNNEIKKIGEIYTPWPSWVITVRRDFIDKNKEVVKNFMASVNKGVEYFQKNQAEAANYIATNLDYSHEDASEWLKTVKFNQQIGVAPIDWERVVGNTASVLTTAGVLTDDQVTINKRLDSGVIKLL